MHFNIAQCASVLEFLLLQPGYVILDIIIFALFNKKLSGSLNIVSFDFDSQEYILYIVYPSP
jgi:hypothetical protein